MYINFSKTFYVKYLFYIKYKTFSTVYFIYSKFKLL